MTFTSVRGVGRTVLEEDVGAGQQRAGLVEVLFVGERVAQLGVVGADAEGDRQRVGVARDAEELHEAEVAAELGFGEVDAAGPVVPARHVHDPALDDRLFDVDAERLEQFRQVRPSTTGVHDEVAADLAPVFERQRRPPSERRQPVRPAISDATPASVMAVTFGSCDHRIAQRPLEGGATNDHDLEVFVAGLRARRRLPPPGMANATGVVQLFEHVGEAVAQDHDDARQEAVGLVHLRRAATGRVERLLGVGGSRQRIALEQRDVMAGAVHRQRGTEAADARPNHNDVFLVAQDIPSPMTAGCW